MARVAGNSEGDFKVNQSDINTGGARGNKNTPLGKNLHSSVLKYPLDLLNEVFTKFPNDCANMNKIEDVLFKFDISSCYY